VNDALMRMPELQLQLIQLLGALGRAAELLALELGDHQLEMRDHRLSAARPSLSFPRPQLGGSQQRLQHYNVVGTRLRAIAHGKSESQIPAPDS